MRATLVSSASAMNPVFVIAAGPWGIGWQEVVMIFLILAILAIPGIIVVAIVLVILRRQRKKRGVPPPLPAQHTQQQ